MSDGLVSEAIRQFFAGNFHQDWDLEAESWQDVVDKYAANCSPAGLYALGQDIDDLRRARLEDELKVLMPRQALSAYNPRPQAYGEWLGQVADRLRDRAAEIERGRP